MKEGDEVNSLISAGLIVHGSVGNLQGVLF